VDNTADYLSFEPAGTVCEFILGVEKVAGFKVNLIDFYANMPIG
jgi:hypothetical protein